MDQPTTRVLIIEGDADESSIIGTYLSEAADRGEKYALTQASRLSTASRLLARQTFDVVLIDLVLPQCVGLEGFCQIHETNASIPIIVLTGLQDVPLAVQAVSRGAYDYFIKGSPDCFLIKRAIRYALERKRLTDAIEGLLGADDAPKLVVDSGGVVRYANAAAQSALARGAKADLLNKPFGHVLPETDAEETIPDPKSSGGALVLRARPISWNGGPARLVALRDSASPEHLKRLQAEVNEGLRMIKIKNHFMNKISHELRNTLSTLTTASYCLQDGVTGPLTPRQARLVEMISRNAERQAKIVENVLDLARFQSGKLKIRFRPVDLNAIIAHLAEECALKSGGPALTVDADRALPPVKGDADLLSQVLRNLLDNAFRFARHKVVLEASRTGTDGVRFRVVDDGPGIPTERLDELFTAYSRLESAAAEPAPGASGHKSTGLGLTICKEIVEGHGGKIWAENASGRGARFAFTLPAPAQTENPFSEDEVPAVMNRSQRSDAPAMAPASSRRL
ncbi:MAG: ATP-binding protein [Elusimicrobiota bacterium]